MDWHQSMSTRATWTEMRQAFLKAFGKQWVDMSLDEKTTHRLAREEPYSYTTRILRNLEHTHPEYSSALVKRFQASGSSAAPVLAAYESPSVARQMENTTKSANTDLQMKALADEIASLKVRLKTER
ncbi:hypothetical protein BV898_09918 [Hypsibius exemplaris]|uniref:Uncharacterized protein n=1 Tax=Hypsibius exemplaris TaxID=2072580 RepID=A0A1W0WLB3_HYPEX|nr:hypothetical protein BV898_09918 [Hypsibius exemplaris]